MFMLYAIPIGLVVGLLLGGRPGRLAGIQLRLAWLAVLAFVLQTLLFAPGVGRIVGDAGPPLYVLSNVLVLVAILANGRIPGVPVVALGAALNLLVVVLNGGYMPADAAAYAARGMTIEGFANTRFIEAPVLGVLGDWIALPTWLPMGNVISLGDLLIATGVGLVIALGMRAGAPGPAPAPGAEPA